MTTQPLIPPTPRPAPRVFNVRYFIKFPFAVLLGIWSALFWRMPTAEDVVTFVEGTSLVTVLRRDRAAERAALASSGEIARAQSRATEERHYYIQVDECMLEHVSRERGCRYDEGVVTPIESWSMKYTKTRCGGPDDKWAVEITSFVVNGQPVADPESQISFLHFYWTTAAHTKCHTLGNALVERIVSDDDMKTKLMESTWTTTWLHHGLLHGSLGPLTTTRCGGGPAREGRRVSCVKSLFASDHMYPGYSFDMYIYIYIFKMCQWLLNEPKQIFTSRVFPTMPRGKNNFRSHDEYSICIFGSVVYLK